MSFNPNEFDRSYRPANVDMSRVGAYATKVYAWMFVGLMITFITAVALYVTGGVFYLFAIPGVQFVLFLAEVGVVMYLCSRIYTLSVSTARMLFMFYAVLNGVVFSTLLVAYDVMSVVFVFGLTSVYFGALSVYGHVTKADLSKLRPILMSGLIFMVAINVLSIFIPFGSSFEKMVCMGGVALFLAFTAYDTQKMRQFYTRFQHDQALLESASVIFALQLYLDFINLFLYLIRVMGNRKQD